MTRDPTKDHTRTVDSICTTMEKLDAILLASTIPADDRLRSIASQMGDRLMLLDAKEKEPSVSFSAHSEYPPVNKTAQEAYQRASIEIPHFSGEVEDWQTFWVQFKEAVHDSKKLTNGAKLIYLRQAMDDQSLKRLLSDSVGGEDFYENMVTVLQKRFDTPREIHVIHCRTLADLQPIKAKQKELRKLADTLFSAVTGIDRLGQSDVNSIATSLLFQLRSGQSGKIGQKSPSLCLL